MRVGYQDRGEQSDRGCTGAERQTRCHSRRTCPGPEPTQVGPVQAQHPKSDDPGSEGKAQQLAGSRNDGLSGPWLHQRVEAAAHVAVGDLGPERHEERAGGNTQQHKGDRPADRLGKGNSLGTGGRRDQSSGRSLGPTARVIAAASPTFRRSPVRKGTKPMRNAVPGSPPSRAS